MCVCAHACVQIKMHICLCACGGQRASPLGDILQTLFILFSKTGSLAGILVLTH